MSSSTSRFRPINTCELVVIWRRPCDEGGRDSRNKRRYRGDLVTAVGSSLDGGSLRPRRWLGRDSGSSLPDVSSNLNPSTILGDPRHLDEQLSLSLAVRNVGK